MSARRLAFILPHLRVGGAERAVVNWAQVLDRSRYSPVVMLKQVDGGFLGELPDDVPVIDMGGARAARLPARIADLLATHRIDIAYSATSAMNLALCAARRRHACPIVISEHSSPLAYLAQAKWAWARRQAMRRLFPRASAMFVPTDDIAAQMAGIVPRLPPLVTIPNPVVDAFVPVTQRPPRVPGDQLRMLSAGRLVPAKGYDVLIQACARLYAQGIPFTLDIFGEGAEKAALRALIDRLHLGDRVQLRGHSADLAGRIAAADLFVLASRREGFGNVLVEAMAVGTPVVAAASAGPAMLIRDGETGLLVPAEDSDALADAMAAVAVDPAAAAVRAAAAHATAQRYDIAASAQALADALDGA